MHAEKSLRDMVRSYGNHEISSAINEAYSRADRVALNALAHEVDQRIERHRSKGVELDKLYEESHGALMRLGERENGTE